MSTFKLPDLGEGLAEAEIVAWHVKVGDHVRVDQPMVSVETAKAVVEVPAPFSGIVTALRGAPGDIVPTGAPLDRIRFRNGGRQHARDQRRGIRRNRPRSAPRRGHGGNSGAPRRTRGAGAGQTVWASTSRRFAAAAAPE